MDVHHVRRLKLRNRKMPSQQSSSGLISLHLALICIHWQRPGVECSDLNLVNHLGIKVLHRCLYHRHAGRRVASAHDNNQPTHRETITEHQPRPKRQPPMPHKQLTTGTKPSTFGLIRFSPLCRPMIHKVLHRLVKFEVALRLPVHCHPRTLHHELQLHRQTRF